jgi:hypothetical protein
VLVNNTLVSLQGTQTQPVVGNKFQGITFRDAARTYLEPHGVPSGTHADTSKFSKHITSSLSLLGGDWGLARMGAVFLEGTEKV